MLEHQVREGPCLNSRTRRLRMPILSLCLLWLFFHPVQMHDVGDLVSDLLLR
jgi:hypothetical protein